MVTHSRECSNYHTTALISHVSKVMLKILQARLQQYMNQELPPVQAGFRKGRKPDIKLPTPTGQQKKQENSRKASASLTTLKSLTVFNSNSVVSNSLQSYGLQYVRLQEMGVPDHPTWLLKNLYAGQEATVRTLYGTTDWFKIEKGVRQYDRAGCCHPVCLIYMLSTS